MKDTCNWGECYYSTLFDKREQCPYYHILHWQKGKGEVTMTHDCTTRRTMLMVQDLYNRLIGVQQSAEEERNQTHELVEVMGRVIEAVQDNPEAKIIINRTVQQSDGTMKVNGGDDGDKNLHVHKLT